jgi:hypothetical protein
MTPFAGHLAKTLQFFLAVTALLGERFIALKG